MVEFSLDIESNTADNKLKLLVRRQQDIEQKVLKRVAEGVISYTQTNKLRGQVLKRQTGNLANSLSYRMSGAHSVRVGPGMVYGAVHEFGKASAPGPDGGVISVAVRKRPWLAPGIKEYLETGRAKADIEALLQRELNKL